MIKNGRLNELMLEAQKSVQFLSNSNKSKEELILKRFTELCDAEFSKYTLTEDYTMDIIDCVENQIDEIIDHFEYAKVHSYMLDVGWHWATVGGVPTVAQMKDYNRNYLHKVYDEAYKKLLNKKPNKKKATAYMGTGGFEYECTVYRDTPKPYFTMKFVIADRFNED